MRIRYMTLPEEWDGERFKERFILIIDKQEDEQYDAWENDTLWRLLERSGAVDVLVVTEEVEIGDSK